jgi:hypothetical protein
MAVIAVSDKENSAERTIKTIKTKNSTLIALKLIS